jgi:enoyl-CoA hydratase/carnithine racemase
MPPLLTRIEGRIAHLVLNRPARRNALDDALIAALAEFFERPPAAVRVALLTGAGGHFSAGLDLAEHPARSAAEVFHHSRFWHRVMDRIHTGGLPVVAVLQGAVIGGGLELAAACHVRVAAPSAFFQLPEARRGIFTGGGAALRIGRILGADRLTDMMLTGRTYTAEEGHRLGLAHYLAAEGEAKAQELARTIAGNARLSNTLVVQALARIADMATADGLFTESLCAALVQTTDDAREGLKAFLEKRPPDFA